MPSRDVTALLGEWEGYRIGFVERHESDGDGSGPQVWVELIHNSDGPMICSGCGRASERYHDWEERWIRDLPILDAQTRLLIQRFRVACPTCGPKVEHLPWLAKYSRVTARLAQSVARLCQALPIKHVAEFYGLGWDAVKAIDKAYLQTALGEALLGVVRPGHSQQDRPSQTLRPTTRRQDRWHPGSQQVPAAHQPAGGHDEQDQSDQANGLRLPR